MLANLLTAHWIEKLYNPAVLILRCCDGRLTVPGADLPERRNLRNSGGAGRAGERPAAPSPFD